MKVLLMDLDVVRRRRPFPNLALMKLSAYHKMRGNEVYLNFPLQWPDITYASCVFTWNREREPTVPVGGILGGSGFGHKAELPPEVEHTKPDYDLYAGVDFSLGFTCYDDKTEVLTQTGWKPLASVIYSDEIATLSEAGELEYRRPITVIKRPYEGILLYFENKYINLLVTPNHELYIDTWGGFRFLRADVVRNYYKFRFKKTAVWRGQEKEYFELPRAASRTGKTKHFGKLRMDDWLEFLGYYLAEGSPQHKKTRNYIVKISQNIKSSSYEMIENCLKRLGFSYYKHPRDGFYINGKELYSYLQFSGHAHEKHVPREFMELSPRQLAILFNAMVATDGHSVPNKRGDASSGIITSSPRLASDFQELLLKMGACGDIRIKTKKVTKSFFKRERRYIKTLHDIFHIYRNRYYTHPYFSKQHNQVKEVIYHGFVYCVEVPNHIIYVRREGKAVWSGNSRGCVRGCPWCIVPEKEGGIRPAARIYEFWDRRHRRIVLLDNNLLAAPNWRQTMEDLIAEGLEVDFNQGLDIRLVNEANIEYLKRVRARELRFAFDDISSEREVRGGIELLLASGLNSRRLSFYFLYGFPAIRQECVERAEILASYKVDVYPMAYRGPDGKEPQRRILKVGRLPLLHGSRQNIDKFLRLVGRLPE